MLTEGPIQARKVLAVVTGLLLNFNVTASSSLPSGAIDSLNAIFNVSNQQQTSLPVAVFLIGYVTGPIIFIANEFNAETFAPVILRRHARAQYSLQSKSLSINPPKARSLGEQMTVILTRPIRMFAEPLVLLTDLFLLYQYEILSLF